MINGLLFDRICFGNIALHDCGCDLLKLHEVVTWLPVEIDAPSSTC